MTVLDEHPSYAKPLIVEAICQFLYQPPQQAVWQPNRPGALIQKLGSQFPILEPGHAQPYPMFGGQTVALPFNPLNMVQSPLKMMTEKRDRSLTVGVGSFVYSCGSPYPGWDMFAAEIQRNWISFAEISNPDHVNKVSLRYVNSIPRGDGFKISEWINPTDTIPAAVLQSARDPFLCRTETWINESTVLVLNLGLAKKFPLDTNYLILLDIDVQVESRFEPSMESLRPVMNDIHSIIWNQFNSAVGPKLLQYMNAGLS